MNNEIKILSASGQLGYGIPEDAFRRGIAARPDVIGVDMGSVDPGPYCLGSGQMMVGGEGLRRDLRMVLEAQNETGAPLLMGSAGTAGRREHLAAVVTMIEEIAKERGLSFKMAIIPADVPVERTDGEARGQPQRMGTGNPEHSRRTRHREHRTEGTAWPGRQLPRYGVRVTGRRSGTRGNTVQHDRRRTQGKTSSQQC